MTAERTRGLSLPYEFRPSNLLNILLRQFLWRIWHTETAKSYAFLEDVLDGYIIFSAIQHFHMKKYI
jgi:hypothetical protein